MNPPAGFGFAAGPVLVQPDGKILLGGTASEIAYSSDIFQTVLARYNANGTPDTSFGSGGSIQVTASQGVSAMALLLSGDIVTVNAGDGNVVEITPAGAQNGVVNTGFGSGSLFGLAITPDNKGVYFVNDGNNSLQLLH